MAISGMTSRKAADHITEALHRLNIGCKHMGSFRHHGVLPPNTQTNRSTCDTALSRQGTRRIYLP
jgi:hypothetical protein